MRGRVTVGGSGAYRRCRGQNGAERQQRERALWWQKNGGGARAVEKMELGRKTKEMARVKLLSYLKGMGRSWVVDSVRPRSP